MPNAKTRKARKLLLNPLWAVAYIRVSTEEQDIGPEVQRRDIQQWADHAGVEIVAWHEERLSGSTTLDKRPEFSAALASMRENRAGILVAQKRDRLARGEDMMLAGAIHRVVEGMGAVVRTSDNVANGDTPHDVFMRGILDLVAGYERSQICERTAKAMQSKARKGEYNGGPLPYGFCVQVVDGVKMMAKEPTEQLTVATLTAFREDGLSLRAVVAKAAQGNLTNRGRAWSPCTVSNMLKSQQRVVIADAQAGA
jgi:DNA invertase Pin-like site-specific DNA recombinase